MAKTLDEARRDLLHVMPHLYLAMVQGEAQVPGGKAELGIIVKRPDGSGQLTAILRANSHFPYEATIAHVGGLDPATTLRLVRALPAERASTAERRVERDAALDGPCACGATHSAAEEVAKLRAMAEGHVSLITVPKRAGIYIASKTVHAHRWLALRASGVPIVSTWIDEAGAGQTTDWADLWDRCVHEVSTAAVCIVYVEPGEQLKGALVEMGAALLAGVPVLWVGADYGTNTRHRLIRKVATIEEAIAIATAAPTIPADSSRVACTTRSVVLTAEEARAAAEGTLREIRQRMEPQPEHRWNYVYETTFCRGDHPRYIECADFPSEHVHIDCPLGRPGDVVKALGLSWPISSVRCEKSPGGGWEWVVQLGERAERDSTS